jgi:hypothetical protein
MEGRGRCDRPPDADRHHGSRRGQQPGRRGLLLPRPGWREVHLEPPDLRRHADALLLPAELAADPEVDPGEEGEVCTISGQTNQWAWDLASGGGTLTDPDDANASVRSLVLGNGAPTDPRLTISKDLNGNLVIKITAQTSTGAIANPEPPPNSLDLVDLIYWRQNF